MDDRDSLPVHYNDGNRAFLQALLARGTMTFKEAQPVLAAIFSAQEGGGRRGRGPRTEAREVTQADFESYVSAASAALSAFDLEVRSGRHQGTGRRVYAVVNTTSDALTQMATLHNAEEIAFVKRVIDAMFDKYNTPRMEVMCLDEMQANKLRRAPTTPHPLRPEDDDDGDETMAQAEDRDTQTQAQALRGLKSSEAEAVMRSMVEEGWFERSREGGLYGLSARALLELRSWLVESYNDPDAEPGEWQRVKFCEACREIVTVGQRCADRDCVARLHDICEDAFWRTRGGRGGGGDDSNGRQRACPRCGRAWDGRHFVGERAVTETEAYRRGRRRSGKGGRSSNLVEQIVNEGEEEEEEEEEVGDGDEDEDDEE
ncbi:putative DNA repair protein Nse1 [Biscogniauxia sp. FL1348]|nr:putative DNA repair protein Nse1 [Biscogniauxia sp. FL1348]